MPFNILLLVYWEFQFDYHHHHHHHHHHYYYYYYYYRIIYYSGNKKGVGEGVAFA